MNKSIILNIYRIISNTNSSYSMVYAFGNYTCCSKFRRLEIFHSPGAMGSLVEAPSLLRPLVIFNFSLAKNIKCTLLIFRKILKINRMNKRYWTKSPNRQRMPSIRRVRKMHFSNATNSSWSNYASNISLVQIVWIASHLIAKNTLLA